MSRQSTSGMSGLISPIGRGAASQTRRMTASVVGARKAARRLQSESQDLSDVERPAAAEKVGEVCALDIFHDQIGDRPLVLDGVDGDDVIVADGGRRAGLTDEPLAGRA